MAVDGYTVEETAAVLGVPRERVWELLARGILGGSTDLGGGMRVRLKPDPPAPPQAPPRQADAPPEASLEPTPFRELLTEFRSLTERYGQALLALGEARGETAALRGRVEALEARVDLRLPTSSPLSAWDASPWPVALERPARPSDTAPSRSSEPLRREPEASDKAADAPVEESPAPPSAAASAGDDVSDGAGDTPERSGSKKRRARGGRGGRRATEGFAEALARAEDPSVPELPGAAEAAAALAALQADRAAIPAEPPQAIATAPAAPVEAAPTAAVAASSPAERAPDAAVVEELPVEEPVATWDRSRYTTEIGEPEWVSAAEYAGPDDTNMDDAPEAAEPEPRVDQPVATAETPDRLAEGLAALDALANATPAREEVTETPVAEAAVASPEPEPEPEPQAFAIAEPVPAPVAPVAAAAAAPAPAVPRTAMSSTPLAATTWARPLPQRGPAVRAYRRLRRIFPA